MHPQILTDQLTLSQPGEADYAHYITTWAPLPPDFQTILQPLISLPKPEQRKNLNYIVSPIPVGNLIIKHYLATGNGFLNICKIKNV